MTEATEIQRSEKEEHTTDSAEASELSGVEKFVAEWKDELGDQVSVSASTVQDRLLDFWGQLPEGEIRSEIERWLTETLGRSLYTVEDIDDRLDTVVKTGN